MSVTADWGDGLQGLWEAPLQHMLHCCGITIRMLLSEEMFSSQKVTEVFCLGTSCA